MAQITLTYDEKTFQLLEVERPSTVTPTVLEHLAEQAKDVLVVSDREPAVA